MREVTKSEFKRIYFELGGGRDGWTAAYWKHFFEDDPRPDMKFKVKEPATAVGTTMWIVSDFQANEYRLFFVTEDQSEAMLRTPTTED